MKNCEHMFELFWTTEPIAFIKLSKRFITPEILRTIILNNVVSFLSFTVNDLKVLIIQTISSTCNLNFMFDLSSKAKTENLQTLKIESYSYSSK